MTQGSPAGSVWAGLSSAKSRFGLLLRRTLLGTPVLPPPAPSCLSRVGFVQSTPCPPAQKATKPLGSEATRLQCLSLPGTAAGPPAWLHPPLGLGLAEETPLGLAVQKGPTGALSKARESGREVPGNGESSTGRETAWTRPGRGKSAFIH